MKFDKFVKALGSDGVIFDGKWLYGLGCALRIPGTKNVCSDSEIKTPEWFSDILCEVELYTAELNDSILPRRDSKSSEILRIFDEMGNARGERTIPVAITNKSFGFIEKGDACYVCTYDHPLKGEGEEERNALVIARWDGSDEPDIVGVMFDVKREDD